jgi:hypothetical protein
MPVIERKIVVSFRSDGVTAADMFEEVEEAARSWEARLKETKGQLHSVEITHVLP